MSDSISRLPGRPSVEQLRKQAKELLRDYRAGDTTAAERLGAIIPHLANSGPSDDVTLADAQFVLAREYGFESWAKLIIQVEFINPSDPSDRLKQYERLVKDIVVICQSDDAEALQRITDLLGRTYPYPDRRTRLQQQLISLRGPASRIADITPADAQLIVAREFGFENWAKLAESIAQPPSDPRSASFGLSSTPPFYRINWKENTIEPRPPVSKKDWDIIFDVMKELQITGLDANGQMTDDVLARLPQLDFVTRLYLGGSKRITDDGLRHLARMPQLRELDLSGWESTVTDRGLEVLRHLTELRRFQMCWPQCVTDAGAANLTFCDYLERVDLMGTQTGDGAIAALAGKHRLRHFKAGGGVTAAGLSLLHQFPMFKTWQGGETSYALMGFEAKPTYLLFPPVNFTRKGLERLVGLDGLFALNIDGPVQVTAEGLAPLVQLPNLGWLGVDPTDEAMEQLAAMPQLRMVMCQDTKAGDKGFEALSRSRTIEYIWGRKCYGLTGRGFTALAAMPSLRGLAVSCKNVDDAALSALPRFPALRGLMPMDVPDDGFRHVGRCEQLEDLWCMYCRDTGDAATEQIAGLSSLRTYYAGATQITDRSLEILGRLPSLESIEFYECAGITDAGIALLAGLPRLREISIGGSPNVTREGMAAFPPTIRVNYR